MKSFPLWALLSTLLLAGCQSTPSDPAPVAAAPAMSPTQVLLIGKWTMESQIFGVQASLSQSQTFGQLYTYPTTGSSVTTFEFKSDGSAIYNAGASVGGPGPGDSASATYKVTGTVSPTSSAYITFETAPSQVLNINILTTSFLVLDKRTFNANGSIGTEQRRFVR